MQTVEAAGLPERFQERGLGLAVCLAHDVPDAYVNQLIAKSRQPHILTFEGHEDVGSEESPGRFRSLAAYRAWSSGKERIFYMMINDALHPHESPVPDIGGVIWFGRRSNEHAPGRNITFAIRHYAADETHGWGQYVGTGLGTPFMQATHQHVREWYLDEKVWLDVVEGNDTAYSLYSKNGYQEIARVADEAHGERQRIVMVNDTVLAGAELSL